MSTEKDKDTNKKKKRNTLGQRRKKFAWLVPLASIRLTLLLLSLSMILVFVATLEQVRIGIMRRWLNILNPCMESGTTQNSFGVAIS